MAYGIYIYIWNIYIYIYMEYIYMEYIYGKYMDIYMDIWGWIEGQTKTLRLNILNSLGLDRGSTTGYPRLLLVSEIPFWIKFVGNMQSKACLLDSSLMWRVSFDFGLCFALTGDMLRIQRIKCQCIVYTDKYKMIVYSRPHLKCPAK